MEISTYMPHDEKGSGSGERPQQDRLDKAAKFAPIVTAAVNILVWITIFSQFRLNENIADRVWSSQLISTIYDVRCTEILPQARGGEKQPGTEVLKEAPVTDQADDTSEPLQVTESPKEQCSPSFRSREEAVWAYIELQHEYKKPIRLPDADLSGMDLSGKDLSGADLKGAILNGTKLIGAWLQGADLFDAKLVRAELNDAHLAGANLSSANLQGAQLEAADLQDARLEGAELGICGEQQFEDATGVAHKSASLKKAKLRGASLKDAFMCGVDMRDTDLSQVKDHLTQEQVDVARGNAKTTLPIYLPRPKNWEADDQ